ncbi:MAG: SDR family oxidoreductase [Bdellovibrionales bacterium]|nr:SDR family oxidoreductase [Bdellovibrionales bacterium]
MNKLQGKTALVTGGNSGIGLATAKLFREQGAKVIVTARSPETYAKAKKEYGDLFDVVQTDVSKLEDLDRLYAHIKSKYDGLDVIFANAGVAAFAPSTDSTAEFFDRHFDTNVRGLYFTVTKALPLLRPGSSVVLNASVVASKGFDGSSVYSATKAAVRSFARSWTAEIPAEKARFNVLSPGPIETPIFGKMGLTAEQAAGFTEGMKKSIPARRLGRPEEMANVALFLASSDSSYLLGADIVADGGLGQI